MHSHGYAANLGYQTVHGDVTTAAETPFRSDASHCRSSRHSPVYVANLGGQTVHVDVTAAAETPARSDHKDSGEIGCVDSALGRGPGTRPQSHTCS